MKLDVNGVVHELAVPAHETLIESLRDRLGLTGAKQACSMGNCGTCTVRVDGATVYSCLVLTLECDARTVDTFALAGAAITATIEDGVIRRPRVVLSGVANVPRRATATEELLADAQLSTDTIEQAARAALHGSRPLSENRYKQQLVVALVRDALTSLRST